MNWVYLFTSFKGRISRQPFWIAMLVLAAGEGILALVNQQIASDRISVLSDLVLIYPEFAVFAKRGHDRNIPTWIVGILFAVSILFDLLVLLGLVRDTDAENYSTLVYLLLIPFGLFAIVVFADLGFRRGTRGPNRFGHDPLETAI